MISKVKASNAFEVLSALQSFSDKLTQTSNHELHCSLCSCRYGLLQ